MTTTDTTYRATTRLRADELQALADQLRVQSIEMTDRAGSGHPTSSMSAADLVAVLVAKHFRIDRERPDALGNDRLIFSKGHASPLLYSALDMIGVLDGGEEVVDEYRQLESTLEGHPTPRIPGVQVATGSLGLGLSMGVGMTLAHRRLASLDAHVWVLCGDGELAEGSTWEAVEHAGTAGLAGLTALVDVNRLGQTGPTRHGWDIEAYERRFAAFGWTTVAIDGHDIDAIDAALATARDSDTPTAIIARTHKGAGVDEVDDVEGKHGKPLEDPAAAIASLGDHPRRRICPMAPMALFDAAVHDRDAALRPNGMPAWKVGDEIATRDAFGAALAALGAHRADLVALDGEVSDSTRLARFGDEFPERFFQMYIAEQLMVGAAIGLNASGWTPVLATFGAFLSRAHDVLRMAAISRSDLAVIGSHAGVSIGEDGPSQMALEDLAMMRSIAGSTVLSPSDATQTVALVEQMIGRSGISYLRTMRGDSPVLYESGTQFPIGGSCMVRTCDEPDVTLIAAGVSVHDALEAADRLDERGVAAEVIDVYSIKPLDSDTVADAAARTGRLVVIEDHRPEGGLGEAVGLVLAEAVASVTSFTHLAVREIPGSATPDEQRAAAGIDASAIVRAVNEMS